MKRLILHLTETLLMSFQENEQTKNLNSFTAYIDKLYRKYDLWIICNAAFPQSIITIRHNLRGLLPQDRILVFHLPFQNSINPFEKEVNHLIEEYFLSQLHPEIILHMDHSHIGGTSSGCQVSVSRAKMRKVPSDHKVQPKPSLAYFSPIPPVKSGIAHYSKELLPHISKYYDITLVIDPITTQLANKKGPYKILSVDAFKEQYENFDRILYHFGNSSYHSYMWPLLKDYPGIVVLHDFFLSGLLSYEEFANGKTVWTEQLFKSHGYHALQMRFDDDKIEELKYRYPCNYEILQYATGIVVHSEYAKNLANDWYNPHPLNRWSTVPLLREPVTERDKKNSRAFLSLPEDALILCSFGILNATKLNHMLIQAFLKSYLSGIPNCYLVFVGENKSGEYAIKLEEIIKASGLKKQIIITGWVDDNTFHHYLSATDIGIQLRTASRGESSASVLDCMNYGLATIINANGSMAELPKDAVLMLNDNLTIDDLVDALEKLQKDKNFRTGLGQKAKRYIQEYHNPFICAEKYQKTIEKNYTKHKTYNDLISKLAKMEQTSTAVSQELNKISDSISHSTLQKITQTQLLVDVSAIVQNDLRTGIERVVRAQLLELIAITPDTVRVEPVYLSEENGLHYRYAPAFTANILNIPVHIREEVVDVKNGDIFYGLDFYRDGVIKAAESGIFTHWAAKGVTINFAVYDLLPIRYPHFFPEGTSDLHSKWLEAIVPVSDTLVCISNTVANELKTWISSYLPETLEKNIHIETVHLGSDITASAPTEELPDNAKETLDQIGTKTTFLMVGTIEPRKGHLQVLAAFELLWEKQEDIHLVIIGSEGWKSLPDSDRRTIPETINKIKNHPQLGKKLFWFEKASDLFLETLYRQSDALIAASEDEGFGLPLIEAAHYTLPIIARDIPVFKEVASRHAFYFPNDNEPLTLSNAIIEWLNSYRNGGHILSEEMNYISWEENAQRVIDLLLSNGR
ncbi:glycosyltransferase [Sulfurovum sp. NBC37-1]|uniref:glycosyltransferase n=1 Tax=Sulfurovum sp. (strain NBC37-1) TaxID=387093 RepID=UPI0001587704|nr:glycosyltransferase [Sulfurovum sp. NBC37-1]BAF71288.1 glycosyl transferase [Sulfurovum sp. NBC37-1]